MFLSDKDIKVAVQKGDIRIDGFDEARLNPASYDILLGNKFFATDPHTTPFIDPVNKIFPPMHEINVQDGEAFVLHPGFSILGYSLDFFGTDKYLIQLNGKSSLARIGLLVHASAPIINPGHYLNVALELFNLNNVPILLRPKMRVGQLTFSILSNDTSRTYRETGRYVDDNIKGWVPERDAFGKAQKQKTQTPNRAAARSRAERDKTQNTEPIIQKVEFVQHVMPEMIVKNQKPNNKMPNKIQIPNIKNQTEPAKAPGKSHLPKPKKEKVRLPKGQKIQFKKGTRGH